MSGLSQYFTIIELPLWVVTPPFIETKHQFNPTVAYRPKADIVITRKAL